MLTLCIAIVVISHFLSLFLLLFFFPIVILVVSELFNSLIHFCVHHQFMLLFLTVVFNKPWHCWPAIRRVTYLVIFSCWILLSDDLGLPDIFNLITFFLNNLTLLMLCPFHLSVKWLHPTHCIPCFYFKLVGYVYLKFLDFINLNFLKSFNHSKNLYCFHKD